MWLVNNLPYSVHLLSIAYSIVYIEGGKFTLAHRLEILKSRAFEALQVQLCLSVFGETLPTTWLHLFLINAPEVQLLFEQRAAYISRCVQFASPVVVEYMYENSRVPIKEELFANCRFRIESFCEPS